MTRACATGCLLLLLLGNAVAWTRPLAGQARPSTYDRVWRAAELWRNQDNPVAQSVRLRGRLHLDYATVRDAPRSLRQWNVRRTRLGIVSRLLRELQVMAEVELNPQEVDSLYVRLTHVNVEWSRDPRLSVRFGKVPARFTVDGSTSSNELLAMDRNALTANVWFTEQYMPGLMVSGAVSHWIYQLGVYSAGSASREFGSFSGTGFVLATLGYDLGEALGADEALLRASYVYQDPDPENTFTPEFRHVGSVNLQLEAGRWGVRADVSGAAGVGGRPDVWGTVAMPYLRVTNRLQLVGRYTHVESAGSNGLVLPSYEGTFVTELGDRYRELYLGINYYLYGHKLKVQSGVEFGDMADAPDDGGRYSGVALTTGLRLSW